MTRTRPSPAARRTLLLGTALASLAAVPGVAHAQAFNGTPTTQAGSVTYNRATPGIETVTVNSPQAVIRWNPGTGTFLPAGNTATFQGAAGNPNFAVLNRIIPTSGLPIVIDGNIIARVSATNATRGGTVAFYSPTGLIIGQNAVIDVGSLVLSALDPVFDTAGTFVSPGGAISFQANPNAPGALVTTLTGSRITAAQEGSYVVFAAPGINHGGSVRANGSVAYVAAGAATVTHNAGLFDIEVSAGTTLATPLIHTGSTTGPASTGAADRHQIVMNATSEGTAFQALIGGTVGYDAPLSAAIENGAIIISTRAAGSLPGDAAAAQLIINGGSFTSDVLAQSSHDASVEGNVSFTQDLTVAGPRTVRVTAGANQAITIGGDLLATSASAVSNDEGLDGTGGDVRVSASDGGTIAIAGNAAVRADGIGLIERTGELVGNGTGGTAEVVAAGGTITVAGDLTITADGMTEPQTNFIPFLGGIGRGGIARLAASNDGLVTVGGGFTASANGTAARTQGFDTVPPGGTGGNAVVETADGIITITGASVLTATGTGGEVVPGVVVNRPLGTRAAPIVNADDAPGVGGQGQGGQVTFNAFGGSIDMNGGLTVDVQGRGGDGAGGGDGLGGDVLITSFAGGRVRALGTAFINANGIGGLANAPGYTGGIGDGGTVRIRAFSAGFGAGTIDFGATTILAAGLGGSGGGGILSPSPQAPGNGGLGIGGLITVTADTDAGILTMTSLTADARGLGGAGGVGAGPQADGNGGAATGGTVIAGVIVAEGGSGAGTGQATFGSVSLDGGAAGGAGGIGGAATGGDAALLSEGGLAVTVNGAVGVNANAVGGDGQTGGAGQGGIASIRADAGTIRVFGGAFVEARGTGGAITAGGTTGGAGTGGTARIAAANDAVIEINGNADVYTTGSGGGRDPSGSGLQGGAGTGGASSIEATDTARVSVGGIALLDTIGVGGTADRAGAATGGNATVSASGAGSRVALGGVYLRADAIGRGNGTGPADDSDAVTGGTALLTADNGGAVEIGTSQIGGSGTSALLSSRATFSGAFSGAGAAATGGVGTASATGGSLTLSSGLRIDSGAVGGQGLTGGSGTGGTSTVQLGTGGSLNVTGGGIALVANGTGGAGASGAGGAGTGGSALLDAGTGTIDTDSITLTANGLGGTGLTAGGSGAGGAVSATVGAGGRITTRGADSRIAALGTGGAGATTGAGAGGSATIAVAAGGQLTMPGNATIDVSGANAGTIKATINGAAALGTVSLLANANGAGSGTGGTISLTGASPIAYDVITAEALGSGPAPTAGGILLGNLAGRPGTSNLTARTDGTLTANDLTAAANLTLTTGAGALTATNLSSGATATLRTGTGAMNVTGLFAQEASFATAGGALTATNITTNATTSFSAGTGDLTVTNLASTDASFTTTTGAIRIDGAAGQDIAVTSAGGTITLNNVRARGNLPVNSGGGAITGTALRSNALATINSGGGTIAIDGFFAQEGRINSGGGALTARNLETNAALTLDSGAGNLTVENTLAATSSFSTTSGTLTATGINGGSTTLSTTGGALNATNIDVGGVANLSSGTGNLNAQNIRAFNSTLSTTTGTLTANTITGVSTTLTTSGGALNATGINVGATATLSSETGALTASNVRGASAVRLSTTSGTLNANTIAGGVVAAATTGGTLTATGVTATSNANLSSGSGNLAATNVTGGSGVTIATTSGTLSATTIGGGAATLSTSGGALSATGINVTGNASLSSGAGTLTADNVRAAASSLTTTTGTLTASNIAGGSTTLTTGGGALNATSVNVTGTANLSSGTANLTASNLTAGTSIGLTTTSGTLSATNLNSGQISLTTGSGALGGAGLTAGQALTATSTSGLISLTDIAAGATIAIATNNLVRLAGNIGAPQVGVESTDIAITSNANVGGAGAQVRLAVRPGSTGGQAVLGGSTQGPGYTLDAVEANRIQGASLTLFVPALGAAANRPADLLVRDVTLDGGRLTALRLQTPGIVQVNGNLLLANAGAGHAITIDGTSPAQRVTFVTPGSVRLRDSAGAAAGTLTIDARDIWVADAATVAQLAADRNFAGRDAALLRPATVFAPRGYLEGRNVVLRPAESLFVQNSGTLGAFAGITTGDTLTIQGGSNGQPADVYAFGRRINASGETTGIPFFFQVDFTGQFTNGSDFNTCIINARACGGDNDGDIPGDDIDGGIDDDVDDEFEELPSFLGESLINETALSEPLIEEPVTSGGDSSVWTDEQCPEGGSAEASAACEARQPAVQAPAPGQRP